MKKALSFIIVLTLLLTISISAFAVAVNMTVNQDIGSRGLYTVSSGETMTSITWTGSIPDGLYIERTDTGIFLKGTPTTIGNYAFTLFIKVNTGSEEVTRMVDVSGNITETAAITPTPTVEATSTPTASPTATTTPSTFAITKHPGAENRTAGGYAIFIAKASNANNATWTLVAPDGGQYSIDSFKGKYPNIIVTVDNKTDAGILSSTITLNNVTTDVSGYSAFVTFTDASNSVLTSNSAKMTISAAAAPTPAPTRAPSPTVAPTAKPVTTATPIPTQAVVPTQTPAADTNPSPVPSSVPTDTPQAGSTNTNNEVINHRGSSVGTIIATVLVGLLTVAIAIILILYVQGKLDLSWLENKLEKRTRRDEYEDDDD